MKEVLKTILQMTRLKNEIIQHLLEQHNEHGSQVSSIFRLHQTFNSEIAWNSLVGFLARRETINNIVLVHYFTGDHITDQEILQRDEIDAELKYT